MRPFASYRALPCLIALWLLAGGVLAAEPVRDRVNFSEQASLEVENDLLVAVLFAQEQGRDPARLSERVNRDTGAAIEHARAVPGIAVYTQNYRTQPLYEKNRIVGWRVEQEIRLESRDARALGRLIGELQERRMRVRSVGYRLSPERRRAHLDRVLDLALERFSARADRIARALGRGGWRLIRLSVNESGVHPMPMPRALRMADGVAAGAAAPVPLAAGNARITVSVSGEIELRD